MSPPESRAAIDRGCWPVREVSEVPRYAATQGLKICCAAFGFIGLEKAFPPSVVKAEAREGCSWPHLGGRNEVENRNGACEMEVAAMGSREKLRERRKGELARRYLRIVNGSGVEYVSG